MSDVTVIGLGLMGSALARACVSAGYRTAVWNRDGAKSDPFARAGATVAGSPLGAAEASPLTILCLSGYGTARRLFDPAGQGALSGRTIVQLSTGSPDEAADLQAFLTAKGAAYLDGAILGGPAAIGTAAGRILVCGEIAAWRRHEPVLRCLGGGLRHVGENIRAAAALDLAWLTQRFGAFVGVAHALSLCAAEGVGADTFANAVAEGDDARRIAGVVQAGTYDNPSARLSVWRAANDQILAHADRRGINRGFPELVSRLLTGAEARGLGDMDIAAICRVMREGAG